MPIRRPDWTRRVWRPQKVDSQTTEDHQSTEEEMTSIRPRQSRQVEWEDQERTRPQTRDRDENEAKRGQGEGDTRWKGCLLIPAGLIAHGK